MVIQGADMSVHPAKRLPPVREPVPEVIYACPENGVPEHAGRECGGHPHIYMVLQPESRRVPECETHGKTLRPIA